MAVARRPARQILSLALGIVYGVHQRRVGYRHRPLRLKALRCEYDDQNQVLVATAFDYVEHPKILSQPDANPKELIQEAITQFLQRNNVKGDRIVISVPGQSGLVRFFEPPPVDMKKLADIVRFEARQAIPFPLEEVIWDYQLMGGANEVDGFLMEAEVGLVAMKRDQVYESLEPFRQADLEINIVQLGPICTYNFVAHSLMTDTLAADIYDADNPPESFVIISMGTDTTDLVVTNGFRIWQRNMPIGGNHFTKQLTKELKLTFAKAEHLKRNVREAEDAKSVIQAMRPVFNDLLTEVQRSVGFFQNIERKAQIGGLIMLGNAVKLPGLQQYLAKNLGYELVNVDHERWSARLAGQSVLSLAAVQGQHARLCRLLRVMPAGSRPGEVRHESAAQGDADGAHHPRQEAVGAGDRRRVDDGLRHQLLLRVQRLVQGPSDARPGRRDVGIRHERGG